MSNDDHEGPQHHHPANPIDPIGLANKGTRPEGTR